MYAINARKKPGCSSGPEKLVCCGSRQASGYDVIETVAVGENPKALLFEIQIEARLLIPICDL
jgi:hypothetical protein